MVNTTVEPEVATELTDRVSVPTLTVKLLAAAVVACNGSLYVRVTVTPPAPTVGAGEVLKTGAMLSKVELFVSG